MRELKADLKNRAFKRVYLLYGEERYLLNYYAREFHNVLFAEPADALMNSAVYDGKQIPAQQVIDAANTLPFLCGMRLVCARDTQLFITGRKDDAEAMAAYLPFIPDSTVLVFVESDADKRGRLYKKTAELGRAVEFKTPPEQELTAWVYNILNKLEHKITPEAARLLLKTAMRSMDAIYSEAYKLCDYAGKRVEITEADIYAVCSPSLETRVFDLIDAVACGRLSDALVMYRRMILMREQPLMILTMMARQFRLILQCKAYAERRVPAAAIAKQLEIRDFVVRECLKQGGYFTAERLIAALALCQDADARIKTGLLNAEIGVETVIVKSRAVKEAVNENV